MQHKFIFICGLHRSGTSLLYDILKEQKNISGHTKTNVPKDEGQHIQTVYPIAKKFGGPGKFGFKKKAYLDEKSNLITDANKKLLFEQWSKYWNLNNDFLLEKSPPNIIKSLFLQKMFPNSYFITIYRHPVATSLATKKWSKTSHFSLIDHWITCHKQWNKDKLNLKNYMEFSYEELVENTPDVLTKISLLLKTEISNPLTHIKKDINEKYFALWRKNRRNLFYMRNIKKAEKKFEADINKFKYSFKETYINNS